MEAQRFPEDFDGIIAGAPVLDFTGTQIWGAWNAKALSLAPLSLENIELAPTPSMRDVMRSMDCAMAWKIPAPAMTLSMAFAM